MRLLIEYEHFRKLVRGEVVGLRLHPGPPEIVDVALSDIGQIRMANECLQAYRERTGDVSAAEHEAWERRAEALAEEFTDEESGLPPRTAELDDVAASLQQAAEAEVFEGGEVKSQNLK